jgi:serine/threonine protein kinase
MAAFGQKDGPTLQMPQRGSNEMDDSLPSDDDVAVLEELQQQLRDMNQNALATKSFLFRVRRTADRYVRRTLEHWRRSGIDISFGENVEWVAALTRRGICLKHNHGAGYECSKKRFCNYTHECILCGEKHGLFSRRCGELQKIENFVTLVNVTLQLSKQYRVIDLVLGFKTLSRRVRFSPGNFLRINLRERCNRRRSTAYEVESDPVSEPPTVYSPSRPVESPSQSQSPAPTESADSVVSAESVVGVENPDADSVVSEESVADVENLDATSVSLENLQNMMHTIANADEQVLRNMDPEKRRRLQLACQEADRRLDEVNVDDDVDDDETDYPEKEYDVTVDNKVRFRMVDPIAETAHSLVYHATLHHNSLGISEPVVIKLIRLSRDRNQKNQQIQQMNSHLAILKQLRDLQHVVSMYDRVLQVSDGSSRYAGIVMEFCDMHLGQWIQEDAMRYSETTRTRLIYQLLFTYQEMQSRGVYHRDVKPENILITFKSDHSGLELVPKLCDFEMSRFRADMSSTTAFGTVVGTYNMENRQCWVAPELVENLILMYRGITGQQSAYGSAADVHSLGCVIYFIATNGAALFETPRETKDPHRERYVDRHLDQIQSFMPGKAQLMKQLVLSMVAFNPDDRITFNEAARHPAAWTSHELIGDVIARVGREMGNGLQKTNSVVYSLPRLADVYNRIHAQYPGIAEELLSPRRKQLDPAQLNEIPCLVRELRNLYEHYRSTMNLSSPEAAERTLAMVVGNCIPELMIELARHFQPVR